MRAHTHAHAHAHTHTLPLAFLLQQERTPDDVMCGVVPPAKRFGPTGEIDIDAPIAGYVDPILQRLNKTTLLELWKGNRTALNITARMLAGMRGGVGLSTVSPHAPTCSSHVLNTTLFGALLVFELMCVVRGAWCVVRGAWCVVRGAWCVVCGLWSVVLLRAMRGVLLAVPVACGL